MCFQKVNGLIKCFAAHPAPFHVSIDISVSAREHIFLICCFFNLLLGQAGQSMAGNTKCIFSIKNTTGNALCLEQVGNRSGSLRSIAKVKWIVALWKAWSNSKLKADRAAAATNTFLICCQILDALATD